jgi:hypothetical protein
MTCKFLAGFVILFLVAWVWTCQRQLSLVTAQLVRLETTKTPQTLFGATSVEAAQIQLEAVKLAEANRQRAKQEEAGRQAEKDETSRRYAAAIRDVFAQSEKAKQEATTQSPQYQKRKGEKNVLNQHVYSQALRKISVSSCPTKFQLAWSDLLYQQQREADLMHGIVELSQVVVNRDLSPLDAHAVSDAWHQCEMVALEFGVRTEDSIEEHR